MTRPPTDWKKETRFARAQLRDAKTRIAALEAEAQKRKGQCDSLLFVLNEMARENERLRAEDPDHG